MGILVKTLKKPKKFTLIVLFSVKNNLQVKDTYIIQTSMNIDKILCGTFSRYIENLCEISLIPGALFMRYEALHLALAFFFLVDGVFSQKQAKKN